MWRVFRIALVLSVAFAAVWLAASWPHSLEITYRQTVTFSTPTGDHVASGVIKKKLYASWDGSFRPQVFEDNYGEALGVELPGYGYAFIIFTSSGRGERGPANLFSEACNAQSRRDESPNGWLRRIEAAFADQCSVPSYAQPLVVIFEDPADFTTARIYAALQLPEGLSITSYVIERTNDPVTFGTTDVLTFLGDGRTASYGGLLPMPPGDDRAGPQITRSMFIIGAPF